MLFETVKSEGLSHFSYVIGDEHAGICAVIDPRRDVEVYLEIAQANSVRITHILETHIHADFVSGSRELAAQTGAPIYGGASDDYGFDYRPLHEGDMLELGPLMLEVLHTPGHTPEHVSFVVRGSLGAPANWGVFTGDTLFAGEVGRPDLLGEGTEEQLTRQLYHSLHDKLLKLGDEIIIYPAHGEGSPCGASIGDRPTSTIGYERRHNPIFQARNVDEFAQQVLGSLSPAPRYYPFMKKINAEGPALLGHLPHLPALDVAAFREQIDQPNTIVVDTREPASFGGGHIPGAINIPLRDAFPMWVGWLLQPEQRILLVLGDEAEIDTAHRHLRRVGDDNIIGYLRQGMRTWFEAGAIFARTPQVSIHELREQLKARRGMQILDVRSDSEWEQGHIPAAQHIYLPYVEERLELLDRRQPVATYCGSGFRAGMAASILQRHGFQDVYNIPGSMSAWTSADFPLE